MPGDKQQKEGGTSRSPVIPSLRATIRHPHPGNSRKRLLGLGNVKSSISIGTHLRFQSQYAKFRPLRVLEKKGRHKSEIDNDSKHFLISNYYFGVRYSYYIPLMKDYFK